MKKVYLIANYFHFPKEKESNRFLDLAKLISLDRDIDLEVITSIFYQRTKTIRKQLLDLQNSVPFKVTFIDEPGYSKNISFKRLKSSKIFGLNVLKYIKENKKPDLIYIVVPTLDVGDLISKWAKKENIPLIIDVQDLWPEAFKMAFNIPVISNLLFLPYLTKANRIYKRADCINGVSNTNVERAMSVNKRVKPHNSVFIGIDLKRFDCYAKEPYDFQMRDNCKKLVYCGSLDKSYDIPLVIDALALLKSPPKFIVAGDGYMRSEFEEYAKKKNVDCLFLGYLPYEKMCSLLNRCDIAVNPIISKSVASIINKHGDYCAAGLPIINTQTSLEYRELIEKYNMGFNCDNAEQIADSIELLCEDENLRNQMCHQSRKCAEEKFDRNATYPILYKSIKSFL